LEPALAARRKGILRLVGARTGMAAKRKIAPPKPRLDLPWSQLTRAQQNAVYTRALYDYTQGKGPNPATSGAFGRAKLAAEAKG
jgi:hypothetical protein